jgi:hypothetical protein
MGATLRNLQAQPKILKKNCRNIKSTNQNKHFPLENYVSYHKNVKEPKFRVGATRRNLQAQPKTLKKSSKHQINQSERKFFQKNCVS